VKLFARVFVIYLRYYRIIRRSRDVTMNELEFAISMRCFFSSILLYFLYIFVSIFLSSFCFLFYIVLAIEVFYCIRKDRNVSLSRNNFDTKIFLYIHIYIATNVKIKIFKTMSQRINLSLSL